MWKTAYMYNHVKNYEVGLTVKWVLLANTQPLFKCGINDLSFYIVRNYRFTIFTSFDRFERYQYKYNTHFHLHIVHKKQMEQMMGTYSQESNFTKTVSVIKSTIYPSTITIVPFALKNSQIRTTKTCIAQCVTHRIYS